MTVSISSVSASVVFGALVFWILRQHLQVSQIHFKLHYELVFNAVFDSSSEDVVSVFCRAARPLRQGGGGRFRTVPLDRHSEEHPGPQMEPTL